MTGVSLCVGTMERPDSERQDRKSTRLNSSHSQISYAVFCLKKKKILDKKHRGRHYSQKQRSYAVFCWIKKSILHARLMVHVPSVNFARCGDHDRSAFTYSADGH